MNPSMAMKAMLKKVSTGIAGSEFPRPQETDDTEATPHPRLIEISEL